MINMRPAINAYHIMDKWLHPDSMDKSFVLEEQKEETTSAEEATTSAEEATTSAEERKQAFKEKKSKKLANLVEKTWNESVIGAQAHLEKQEKEEKKSNISPANRYKLKIEKISAAKVEINHQSRLSTKISNIQNVVLRVLAYLGYMLATILTGGLVYFLDRGVTVTDLQAQELVDRKEAMAAETIDSIENID